MTLAVTTTFPIPRTASPNLPLAPVQYEPSYQEQLNNVLRLYFNQIDRIFLDLETSTVSPPLTNYTVATLPSAATSGVGARSFVTNALTPVFGSAVVGGGSVATPVYSNGTNWIVG